jgi:beta-barrel assembly-enhancing protease
MKPRTFRPSPFTAAMVVFVLVVAGCATTAGARSGFNLVSLDQEWQMRDQLRSQVAQEMRLVRDSDSIAYLNLVGRRIAGQTALGNRRWDFGIVNDSSINAFNLPGGLVYVNAGLIAEADSLDELAGVLAHEIGHGAARHGTQLMTRAYGYNVLAGLLLGRNPSQGQQILAQVVGTGVLTNYSRNAELEADRLGVQYTYRAGYDPRGMVNFFEELLAMRSRRPTRVEQFFASHPLTEQRIDTVRATAAQLPRRSSLTHDTRNYQNFRSDFR